MDSVGSVFYAVFSGSAASLPAFSATQIRQLVQDASESKTIVDSGTGGTYTARAKGTIIVGDVGSNTGVQSMLPMATPGERKHVDVQSLSPSSSYVLCIVSEDWPGGPFGPNLQMATSVRDFKTVSASLSKYDLIVTEGSIPSTYQVILSGGTDGSYLDLGEKDCINLTVSAGNQTVGQVKIYASGSYNVDSVTIPACGISEITVSVIAVDDTKIEGTQFISLQHHVSSATGRLTGITAPAGINVQIEDNDKASVIFTSDSSEINEGDTVKLRLRLSDAPPGGYLVTATLSARVFSTFPSLAGSVSFTPETVTFGDGNGAWDTDQIISMKVSRDGGFAYGTRNATVKVTTTSVTSVYNDVISTLPPFIIRDTESVGMNIAPQSVSITESGASVNIGVSLTSRPTSPVIISVSPDSPIAWLSDTLTIDTASTSDLTVSATSESWQSARTVTVSYGGDAHVTGPMTRRLSLFTSSVSDTTGYGTFGLLDAVNVTITDITVGGVTILPTALTIREGESEIFTLRLKSQPFLDVTLTPTIPTVSGLTVGNEMTVLTKSTWSSGVTQRITSERDNTQRGDQTFNITYRSSSLDEFYSSSLGFSSFTVTVIDVDVAELLLTLDDSNDASAQQAVSQVVIEEGAAAKTLRIRLATSPTTDVTVEIQEVSKDGGVPAASLLTLSLEGVQVQTGDSLLQRNFRGGYPSNSANEAVVQLSRSNNEIIEGMQSTFLRVRVKSSTDGDPFYSALPPIMMLVTVRDDETAAITQVVDAGATNSTEIRDGAVSVVIPPGAIRSSVSVSVQQLPNGRLAKQPAEGKFIQQGLVVSYGPEGTSFSSPATISIPVDTGTFCLDHDNHCEFIYRASNNATGDDWSITPGAVFEKTQDGLTVAHLNVTHFSLYTIAVIKPTVSLVVGSGVTTTVNFVERGPAVPVAPLLVGSSSSSGANNVMYASAHFDPDTYIQGEDIITLPGAVCLSDPDVGDASCSVKSGIISGITFSLTATWSMSRGSITISRSSQESSMMSAAQAGAILSNIAYHNPSRNPSIVIREVRFTLRERYSSFTNPAGAHKVGLRQGAR